MKVSFSSQARTDLLEIVAFVAEDSPQAARRLADVLKAKAADLATMSERFAVVGRRDGQIIRRRVHASYAIYYAVEAVEKQVSIIRILHSARDAGRLLFPDD